MGTLLRELGGQVGALVGGDGSSNSEDDALIFQVGHVPIIIHTK